MAAISAQTLTPSPESPKPLLVVHRTPTFSLTFAHRLTPSFFLLDPLSAAGDDPSAVADLLRSLAGDARAALCIGTSPLGKETLDCLPKLECVVVLCAGTDHVDLAECRRRGIAVANVGDAFSDDVADCAVGLIVDVLRRISALDRFVRAGSWPRRGDFDLGHRLEGKRVGIVGLGSIGSRVANRLIPFGCIISYTSRHKKPNLSFPYHDTALSLAAESDILVLCCSLTGQTHHIINKEVLAALGKDGVIINVGRGALIDEGELVRALVGGEIGGAGLDVFEDEPNVPKELFGLDNVVLSPHQAVLTPEGMKAAQDVVVANLEAFFSNKPLLTPVIWD